jgi:hypothetical protein
VSVAPLSTGSYRSHYPACLFSKHVDIDPGDRASTCRGMMRPERVEHRGGKGLVLVHRCVVCGFVRPNRIAEDPGLAVSRASGSAGSPSA